MLLVSAVDCCLDGKASYGQKPGTAYHLWTIRRSTSPFISEPAQQSKYTVLSTWSHS